ncbi:hypothetical protein SAMN04489761_0227 [Tenacibaculum sp. MAR_2009_124]|uniref:hypothetical protein n=1 Tax=Tenacibaculum sp. MAR_2009_124 TaxID=1250059 RepID=UPI000896AA4C|nr:hypothetical protein [Tenacibaculum sp. MAR_2009_124]SEB37128.1 hypothetical protein SAMN04489761_0227 [Tenacibaculum sp. MAR_2009_124]
MNKLIPFLFLFFSTYLLTGQIDENSLISLPAATTTELDNITSPKLGSIAFDTSKDRVVEYTSSGWQEMLTTSNIYVGAFIISSAGSQTISGVPFSPTSITFSAHANVESFNVNSDNGVGNNNTGLNNSYGTMTGFARNDAGTIVQQVIYVGGHGNSINDISRYASNSNCIGIRYGNQNGDNLGVVSASLTSFNTNGFNINISKTGTAATENLVVLFTAYK